MLTMSSITVHSGVASHFLTVRTYDFWYSNSKIKKIIRVYAKVIYFDQRSTFTLVESKQNSAEIEGIKVT